MKDVPDPMRHETVGNPNRSKVDWKGLGYLTSIVSVFFLGAVAWPKAQDPKWVLPVLIVGMAASILGMGFRYLSHLQQQKEIGKAKAEASRK